jgi:Lon-like ATP-dependent protease
VGVVNGLAVYGPNMGMILEVEANAIPAVRGQGRLTVTGMVDEEEIGGGGRTMRRKSMARSSVENVLTVLRRTMEIDPRDFDIHVNFPGGAPADGPSAGITIATAIYSAITGFPVDNKVAMTGEISIRGLVKPIGGVVAKVEAARQAGASKVVVPAENYQDLFKKLPGIKVIPVERLEQVFQAALIRKTKGRKRNLDAPAALDILSAAGFGAGQTISK